MGPVEVSRRGSLISEAFLFPLAVFGKVWRHLPPIEEEVSLKKIGNVALRAILGIGIIVALIPGSIGAYIKYPHTRYETLQTPLITSVQQWREISVRDKEMSVEKIRDIGKLLILGIKILLTSIPASVGAFIEFSSSKGGWVDLSIEGEGIVVDGEELGKVFQRLMSCSDPDTIDLLVTLHTEELSLFRLTTNTSEISREVEGFYAKSFRFTINPLVTVGDILQNTFNEQSSSFALNHPFMEGIAKRLLGVKRDPLSDEEKQFLGDVQDIHLIMFVNEKGEKNLQFSVIWRS